MPTRHILAFCLVVGLVLPNSGLFADLSNLGSYLGRSLFYHNFAAVVEGELYRSGEIPLDKLPAIIQENGIRTVIDLRRGGDKPDHLGRYESAVVRELGAEYISIPLNGRTIPTWERLQPLLEAFENLEKPILVHCTEGTHRSGLAAAIWLMEEHGAPADIARMQASARYGLVPLERKLRRFVDGKPTIDQVLWAYLKENYESPVDFPTWAARTLTEPMEATAAVRSLAP